MDTYLGGWTKMSSLHDTSQFGLGQNKSTTHKLHEKWLDQLVPDRLFIELNLALNKQTG